MKLFITGARGFIGGHFLSQTEHDFAQVVAPQRGEAGSTVRGLHRPGYDGSTAGLCNLLADFEPDVVINCAAAGIHPGERGRRLLADVNSCLPGALFEAAQDSGAQAFVQLGSMAEYSAPKARVKLSESAPTTHENIYGASKSAASSLLSTLAGEGDLHATTLRLFGVFGPGEAPHRLTSQLITRLTQDEIMPLSAGTQVRDFVYIRDVVSAMDAAVKHSLSAAAGHDIVNIGSGVGQSVHDFVKAFCTAGGFSTDKLDFGAMPMRDTDAPYLVADIQRAKAVLGWSPAWTGPKALTDYFSNRVAKP